MLTTFDLDEYVDRALTAGAAGFLLKNSSYEELTAAVRATAAGHRALSPAVTQRIIESHLATWQRPDDGEMARLADLTPRERDVLRLVGDGLSNAEIADRLVVSLHTVKTHVSRMPAKTGLIQKGVRDGMPTRRAVARGITGSAGTVTSAAVVMVAVFSIFGTLSTLDMNSSGSGWPRRSCWTPRSSGPWSCRPR
ncbi:response regulator transcription factor [Actinomadura sp. DC4]|uniref:LuxR C-terminal-related transcriptional regulator n=1 Tax=Actinomadura sp. DC4 TaxID=3055069 RepID=UPI0025AED887|nr:response regulator transcription factor [Actinomadura sp. DC4]MDN3357255.1 response regulator transcription factor [Actinomadura sp. DC4]